MAHNNDYQTASIEYAIELIGTQLEQLRLSKNLSQTKVASKAGVSRRTITRMEAGETVSLDTFIRVLKVYEVADRLAGLFPEQSVRPIERFKFEGRHRQRASSKRSENTPNKPSTEEPWSWGDDERDEEGDE